MKKLLLKVWRWIMKTTRKVDSSVEKVLPVACNVVEGIKFAIESRGLDIVADVAKSLIAGKADDIIIDKAVALAREHVPKIALKLEIARLVTEIEDPREQIIYVFQQLAHTSEEEWAKFCTELGAQLMIDLADDKISWGEASVYVELYYKTYIKN